MKKMNGNTWIRRLQAILLAVVLIVAGLTPVRVQAATTQSVEDIDFSDFSSWRTGLYHWTTGKYVTYPSRICLTDYVTFDSSSYTAHITDTTFRMLVRELDSSKAFLRTTTLANGDAFTPGKNAVYLAISVYSPSKDYTLKYANYKTLFNNGFVAELVAVKTASEDTEDDETTQDSTTLDTETTTTTESEYYDVDTLDFTDFDNWRSGLYHWSTGKYVTYSTRICLNKYATFSADEYEVFSSNSDYHVLIRELDSDLNFIKSYNLADGATYTPSAKAEYLGISIYKANNEWGMTYSKFKTLFNNGLEIGLEAVAEEEDEIVENTTTTNTTTTKTFSTLKEELLDMLETGEMEARDISKYNATYSTVYKTFNSIIENEGYLAYKATYGIYTKTTKDSSGIVQTIQYADMDEDFPTRYAAMVKVVNKCLCAGYTCGLMVLLHEAGIETAFVQNSSHSWVFAKLDGEWYHIDATWDDTRTRTSGAVDHKYFVRNDSEFGSLGHYNWKHYSVDASSTDTTYTDWFVHDVVGRMYYDDGLWYYYDTDTNSIMCSDIMGINQRVVVDGSSADTVTLVSLTNGVLTYKVGSTTYTKNV